MDPQIESPPPWFIATKGEVRRLKAQREFAAARSAIERGAHGRSPTAEQSRWLAQQRALCTYKDALRPALARFTDAMEILEACDPPADTRDPETAGLAGAIEKRRWELTADVDALEASLEHYRHGAGLPTAFAEGSDGYTAINAAYVLDLLVARAASVARGAGGGERARIQQERRAEAEAWRRRVVDEVSPRAQADAGWWALTTVAEAHFGLGRYDAAREWFQRAWALDGVEPWERESTVRQLASLASLREPERAGELLRSMLGGLEAGDAGAMVSSATIGRVGVALSGGGFRASFFHIGVLARLAELDALRHVEVLSCVSGGSIVGAWYYLALKKLLEAKGDAATRDDYVALVADLEREFFEGVKCNVRMTAFASAELQMKMARGREVNVSEHVGKLYAEHLFARADGRVGHRLRDLAIRPKGAGEGFDPRYDNWRRRNKVPTLVINATTLNTGHSWQFTAAAMGEPGGAIDPEIDASTHLQSRPFSAWPEGAGGPGDVTLAQAVAASACVPGVLDPLELKGFHKDPVFLVDGGVFDNQGVSSLLEQDANVLLVSDASGHLEEGAGPPSNPLAVPLQASGILQARVRAAQFRDLVVRRQSLLVRGLMFLHLKQGLDRETVAPTSADGPEGEAPPTSERTAYGVRKDVQALLSRIRTDLDAFSETEAAALMTSGYRMAFAAVPGSLQVDPASAARAWGFLRVEPLMTWEGRAKRPRHFDAFAAHLDIASSGLFKVLRQSKDLQLKARLVAAAVFALLAAFCAFYWDNPIRLDPTVGQVAMAAAVVLALVLVPPLVRARFGLSPPSRSFTFVGSRVMLGVLGALSARIYKRMDRVYLEAGRVARFLDDDPPR